MICPPDGGLCSICPSDGGLCSICSPDGVLCMICPPGGRRVICPPGGKPARCSAVDDHPANRADGVTTGKDPIRGVCSEPVMKVGRRPGRGTGPPHSGRHARRRPKLAQTPILRASRRRRSAPHHVATAAARPWPCQVSAMPFSRRPRAGASARPRASATAPCRSCPGQRTARSGTPGTAPPSGQPPPDGPDGRPSRPPNRHRAQ